MLLIFISNIIFSYPELIVKNLIKYKFKLINDFL